MKNAMEAVKTALSETLNQGLPEVQRRVGQQTLSILNAWYPEYEVGVDLKARVRKQWFTGNIIVEFQVVKVRGFKKEVKNEV